MTETFDPDATRPLGGGGDATLPAGPRVGGATSEGPMVVGPPPSDPPRAQYDDGGDDDEPRRNWWWIAALALALGIAVGVVVALLASGGDDKPEATTTSSSSTSTSTSSTTITTLPPTTQATVPQPPGQVTNLTAEPGGGSGEVSMQWDAVPGAAQYRIYRSGTQGITGSLVATVNTNEYVDVPGAHSYYQVSAVGSGGLEGARSVEVCGAVVGDPC